LWNTCEFGIAEYWDIMSLCKVEIEQKVRLRAAPEGMARIIHSKNPFDVSKHIHELVEVGEQFFISDVISEEMSNLPEELVVTSINGKIVKKDEWAKERINEGDVVVLFEVPGGDDSGKAIIRIVMMIVLVVVTGGAGAAGAFGSVGSFQAAAIEVGFVIAGAILINAILPPIGPDGIDSDGLDSSRTYGIDGAKNTSDEGIPVPVCYGPFRMAGNIINFHTRNIGDEQYLYLLFNAGEGVSAGLVDIELNEQPISGFTNKAVEIRLGDSDQNMIPWFSKTVSPISVGTAVTESFQSRSTGVLDRFRLDFVCPNGLIQYNDDGSRVARTITFEIEYKKTSEPTVWTTLTHRGKVSGINAGYTYYEYDNLGNDGDYVSTVPGAHLADFRDPGDSFIGDTIVNAGGQTVGIRDDDNLYTLSPDIRRKQTSAVRFSFYSPELDEDSYDVRVRRTTVESGDAKVRDRVVWTDLNEIVEDNVSYRHTALLGLKIKLTDQLSALPTVTYVNNGRVIKFWDTANQEWRTGPSTNPAWIVWDALTNQRYGGQMAESRFDVDAWVDWGEYCDNNNLTFQGVFDTKTNLWDSAMHIFRAGHARPLKMGTRYSVAIDRATAPSQMFTVGNIIKGSFNQKWMPITDRANEVELHYFDATDRFKRRTIKVYDDVIVDGAPKNTATATMYGIVDATRAAEEATYMLLNNRYIKSTVSFKVPSEAIAVTIGDVFILQHDQPDWSEGGRLEAGSTTTVMEIDKTVTLDAAKSYKFMVRFDSIVRDTATITAIVGRKLTLGGYAGATNINRCQLTADSSVDRRITRTDTDAIWVDDVTGLSVSDSIDLIETDAIEVMDVPATTSGDLSAIPLTAAMDIAPSQFYLWMLGEDVVIDSEWRVTKLGIDKDLNASINGATYNENIYDWTPLTIQPAPDAGISRIVPHVTNVDAAEGSVNIGGILRPVLDVSWDLPADFENYSGVLIEISVDNEGYRFEKIQRGGLNTKVEVNHNDEIDVRVVAMSSDGRYALNSSAPEVTGLMMSGDTIAPAAPTSSAIAIGTVGIHISWVNPMDADYAGLDIKRNTVDNEGAGTIIFTTGKSQVSYDDVLATDVGESYFYWLRSVDRQGNSSSWTATTPTSRVPSDFGIDATSGWLTNEQHGITSDSDGSNPVFSGANGEFKVWKGSTDITSNCTFSVFSADNLTGTINTDTNNPVTGAKGYYVVTAETLSQDVHSFVVRAVTPDGITIDRTFTVTKNKAGTDASTVHLSAEGMAFSYENLEGVETLVGPIAIDLSVNEQNTSGSTTWLAWDDAGVSINPVTNLLSAVNDSGATISEFAFDGISNNSFVTVRVTRGGISDEITVHKIAGGFAPLGTVPDFGLGQVGGQVDFRYELNDPNEGEITVTGEKFIKPDGTLIIPVTNASSQMTINTPYEGVGSTNLGRFYVMFSEINFETRFSTAAAAPDWNSSDSRFGVVTWTESDGWRARQNNGTYYSFTPLATDVIILTCERRNVDPGSGIGLIYQNAGSMPGDSIYVGVVYRRSLSVPTTPTEDDGQYNFTSKVMTPPADWSASAPDDDGRSLYESVGTFSVVGTTGIDGTVVWSSPVRVQQAVGSGQILSTRDWGLPDINPMGVWNLSAGSANETTMVKDEPGPFGDFPLVMRIAGDGEVASQWFSRWNGNFGYDQNRSYVFYTWVKRNTAGNSLLYMGFSTASHVKNMAGTVSTNPYFISAQSASMTQDKWYLAVGVVWAEDAVSVNQGFAGIYDPEDGTRVYNGGEFQWNGQAAETTYMRMGHYDNFSAIPATDYFDFTRCTGWVMDGLEPSVKAVLGAGAIQGNFKDIKYQRNNAQPATPTGDNPPSWFDEVPNGTSPIWSTTAIKTAQGVLISLWAEPRRNSGPVWRGPYAAGTDYILDDMVSYQERSYVNVQAGSGSAPSGSNSGNANWDLLAGKGDTGATPTPFNQTIAITGSGPINLRTLADNHTPAYDGVGDATVVFQLANGVTITGNPGANNGGDGGHGIDTGSWPQSPTIDLRLEIAGTSRGGGGGGARGGTGFGGGNGNEGCLGGDGIYLQEPMVSGIEIEATGVVEAAGGGAGGGGGRSTGGAEPIDYGGGGGGGAFPNGGSGDGGPSLNPGSDGGSGGIGGGGAGGAGGGVGNAGDGGDGGDVNVTGAGGDGAIGSGFLGAGGAGGTRGNAIRKNGHAATVVNGGTITGAESA